jgi:stage IV sporulation protein B
MPPQSRIIQRILLLIIIFTTAFTTVFYSYLLLPSEQKISVGDVLNPSQFLTSRFNSHISVYVESNEKNVLKINGYPVTQKIYKYNGEQAVVTEPGQLNLSLRLITLRTRARKGSALSENSFRQ